MKTGHSLVIHHYSNIDWRIFRDCFCIFQRGEMSNYFQIWLSCADMNQAFAKQVVRNDHQEPNSGCA
jgi:hypothetical protein